MRGAVPVIGAPYNEITFVKGAGAVRITIRWDWNLTSVDPDFAGTVISINLVNTGAVTWYAHLPMKTRGDKRLDITPGLDVTRTGNTLRNLGLETLATISGLRLSTATL